MSTKPHRTGRHVWKPACATTKQEVKELSPDVIVECYLRAKHYDPVELTDLSDINANFVYLASSDNIQTASEATMDNVNACASFDENFKELDDARISWEQSAEAVNPKWLEHHQSGHLVKDKTCPICVEESGSRVVHWRKKGDRQPRVTHLDLAAFEPSADGHRYCLVAVVTVEVDHVSKLLPIFVAMPNRNAVSGVAAIKEMVVLCNDRNCTTCSHM